MKIAMRQCDITPTRPCWQGGYAQRKTVFEKVNDPIMATVFVLTLENAKKVFLSMDVVGFDRALTDLILARSAEKGVQLEFDDVIFSATHTHSGPQVSANDHYGRQADPEYLERVVETVASAIAGAYEEPGEPVELRYRNTLIDGIYSNRNDRNKHSDKLVHELGFFRGDELVAEIYSMAHHCTVLGPNNMDISADLFGEVRRLLQEEKKVPVLMVQGNAGDMGNKQYRTSNTFDAVVAEAAALVDQIHKKHSDWTPVKAEHCGVRHVSYTAVYDVDAEVFKAKKAEFEEKMKTETDFDTVKLLVTGISSYERKIALGSRHVEREMPARIFDMDELQIVAVPGELGSILGMRIKAASKARVCLLWGYASPCDLGYMVEKEAYGAFSQESNVTDYPAGIPDAYAAAIIENL